MIMSNNVNKGLSDKFEWRQDNPCMVGSNREIGKTDRDPWWIHHRHFTSPSWWLSSLVFIGQSLGVFRYKFGQGAFARLGAWLGVRFGFVALPERFVFRFRSGYSVHRERLDVRERLWVQLGVRSSWFRTFGFLHGWLEVRLGLGFGIVGFGASHMHQIPPGRRDLRHGLHWFSDQDLGLANKAQFGQPRRTQRGYQSALVLWERLPFGHCCRRYMHDMGFTQVGSYLEYKVRWCGTFSFSTCSN